MLKVTSGEHPNDELFDDDIIYELHISTKQSHSLGSIIFDEIKGLEMFLFILKGIMSAHFTKRCKKTIIENCAEPEREDE